MLEKVPGLYEPDIDAASFIEKDAAMKQKLHTLQQQIAEVTRGPIQSIRTDIIVAIEALIAARPEVLEVALVSTPETYPIRSLLEHLRKPDQIDAKVISSLLSTCAERYQKDSFVHDEDAFAQLALANALGRSQRLGTELNGVFSPFIENIRAIMDTRLSPLEREHARTLEELKRAPPCTKANMALHSELQAAINKIKEKAERDKKTGVSQAAPISRLCTELLGKVERREPVKPGTIDEITRTYTALKDKRDGDYACIQMGCLKKVLEAHQANLAKFADQDAFDAYVRLTQHATTPIATGASSRAASATASSAAAKPVVDTEAKQQLRALLTTYLETRAAKREETTGAVKEYLRPAFFPGQNSFSQERDACEALLLFLNDEQPPQPLTEEQTQILRTGGLGNALRAFIQEGHANPIVGREVKTVRGFVSALQEQYPPTHSASL